MILCSIQRNHSTERPNAYAGCQPLSPQIHQLREVDAYGPGLSSRGVEFSEGISDQGYGLVTHFKVPGDFAVQLYQPRYEKRFD